MKILLLIIVVMSCAVAQDITLENLSQIRLRIPSGYNLPKPEVRIFNAGNYSVSLYAQKFSQGKAVYIEIVPVTGTIISSSKINLQYNNRPVYLSARSWGYCGLFPIAPDATPGESPLVITISGTGEPWQHSIPLTIAKSIYPVSRSKLNVGKFSDVNHAQDSQIVNFIVECSRKKKEAFERIGPDRLSSALSYPRTIHHVTSPFWSTRVYLRYEIRNGKRIELPSSSKYHRGIDLRGLRGDPIFALADGEVILAEKMYYEGNFTVIDHGNRVMSYYMHQDSIFVKVGQIVNAGERIGAVGNSGISTAPHLHLSLVIDSVHVDPLSILSLPILSEKEVLQSPIK
jgi:murein DD-endopeptidase MepM/ murein hydrolase activator NlpD